MAETGRAHPLPLVIKVGGSLAETGRLLAALQMIRAATRPVVIVPGGGAFADKVRDLQLAVRFDDAAAHRLAMLGMHQMAELFVPMVAGLRITDSIAGIAEVLKSGDTPVFVPLPTLDADDTIPHDWSITSDGIAARLAELLGGAPLALLKSVDVPDTASAQALQREGIVDAAFPALVARAGIGWHVFGPSHDAAFAAFLEARPPA